MEVEILNESGFLEAMYGLSLNKKTYSQDIYSLIKKSPRTYDIISFLKGEIGLNYISSEQKEAIKKIYELSLKLYNMDGGHNKFLESIEIWLKVKAPLSWWKQADTYRLSTKQSESTMHTIKNRLTITSDYSENTLKETIDSFNKLIENKEHIDVIQDNIPSGFLQTRCWKMSYKTLRNILNQRQSHRYSEWDIFCKSIKEQATFKEYL